MLNQDEQIALFVEAINKDAERLCKKIDKETKQLYTSEVEKLRKKAEEKMLQRINYYKNETQTQFNKSLALDKTANRQLLCNKRSEITQSVFEQVRKEVLAFAESEAYAAFLEKSLKSIFGYTQGAVEIFSRSADAQAVKAIAEKLGADFTVIADDGILLGGVRVVSRNMKKIFDDTLDLRTEEQKEWFLANSSLTINI